MTSLSNSGPHSGGNARLGEKYHEGGQRINQGANAAAKTKTRASSRARTPEPEQKPVAAPHPYISVSAVLIRRKKDSTRIAMRPSLVRLIRPRRPERKAEPLLPPLQLYRAILRAHHSKLPAELRFLGDEYVKAEFKAHKAIDNPLHIVGFLTQWQEYLRSIDGDNWQEGRLLQKDLDKMSPEQIGQLYELMQETKRLGEQAE